MTLFTMLRRYAPASGPHRGPENSTGRLRPQAGPDARRKPAPARGQHRQQEERIGTGPTRSQGQGSKIRGPHMQAPERAKPSRGGDRMGEARSQPMHPESSGPGEAPAERSAPMPIRKPKPKADRLNEDAGPKDRIQRGSIPPARKRRNTGTGGIHILSRNTCAGARG